MTMRAPGQVSPVRVTSVRGSGEWQRRHAAAWAVRGVAFLLPIGSAMIAMAVVSRLLPVADDSGGRVLWWTVVLTAALLAAWRVERMVRRLLPLASLLDLSVTFPEAAPSRFQVARRAASTKAIRRLVDAIGRDARTRPDGQPVDPAARILGLVTALSVHDHRTRGHSERVCGYVDLIAREIGLSAADAERVRWAALLHDLGKLRVPASVLNKPAKLNRQEWELVRAHPGEGQRLAEPLADWLGPWNAAIGEHHERFDGSGYPLGLVGEQISLGARIVAVADAFDVMTSARSYRRALSRADALREVVRCSGTQFDPGVVRAFLQVSTPRLRWAVGPLGWLAGMPVLGSNPSLAAAGLAAQTAVGAGTVALASVATFIPVVVATPGSAAPAASVTTTQPTAPAESPAPVVRPKVAPLAPEAASTPSSVPSAVTDIGGVPPGPAKHGTDGVPPGLAKQAGGVPPGLAKQGPGGVPPGLAKQGTDGVPPGLAKRGTGHGNPVPTPSHPGR